MKNPLISLIWKIHGREAIEIDPARCVRCGKCERLCRHHAIRRADGNRFEIRPEACVRCYHCKEACPRRAIVPSEL